MVKRNEARKHQHLLELYEDGLIDNEIFESETRNTFLSNSKVGHQLSEQTTKNVMFGVLILLVAIPILDGSLVANNDILMRSTLMLHNLHW